MKKIGWNCRGYSNELTVLWYNMFQDIHESSTSTLKSPTGRLDGMTERTGKPGSRIHYMAENHSIFIGNFGDIMKVKLRNYVNYKGCTLRWRSSNHKRKRPLRMKKGMKTTQISWLSVVAQ